MLSYARNPLKSCLFLLFFILLLPFYRNCHTKFKNFHFCYDCKENPNPHLSDEASDNSYLDTAAIMDTKQNRYILWHLSLS